MQSVDLIETYSYGTNKGLVNETVKCNNINATINVQLNVAI